MLQNLLYTLQKITPLNENLIQYLTDKTKTVHILKNEFLLKEAAICRNLYFVGEGFLRAFYWKDDKEVTSWFMGKNDVIISVNSFFTQRPSSENIQALEDCSLLSLSYEDLQYAYQIFPEMNVAGRVLTEIYYIRSEERAIALRQNTARERYEILINTYPEILQKASLGQIATHLGISQETLSRVRAQK